MNNLNNQNKGKLILLFVKNNFKYYKSSNIHNNFNYMTDDKTGLSHYIAKPGSGCYSGIFGNINHLLKFYTIN